MLIKNHPTPPYKGYNDLFSQLYIQMNTEEMELFRIIRGITEESIFRLNNKLQTWVENNPIYKILPTPTPSTDMLEEELLQLKIHFNSWFPKYFSVFLDDEKQALVYLNDEKKQGSKFPRHLKPVITQVIGELEREELE